MNKTRLAALCALTVIIPGFAVAQSAGSVASAGVYSAAQAARGQAKYSSTCAACHGEDLGGQDVAPALTGSKFSGNWKGQTVGDLATRIHTTMPLDNPGSLGAAAVADVTAYILSKNGYPAGQTEMSRDATLLQSTKID